MRDVDLEILHLKLRADGGAALRPGSRFDATGLTALLVDGTLVDFFHEALPDDITDLVGEGLLDSTLDCLFVGSHLILL